MKNIFFLKRGIFLLVLCIGSILISAQQTMSVIGEVRKNAAVITNTTEAAKVLKAGLSNGAQISNLQIGWAGGTENKYFLVGTVTGDKVSAKGIALIQNGSTLLAASGPGVEITCTGTNCNSCTISLSHWPPICVCNSNASGGCDMSSKVVVSPW